MCKRIPKILVTGGAEFIGSAFVRLIIIDKLTYAGDLNRLEEVKGKFKFYKTDICNKTSIQFIFQKERRF